MMGPLFSTGTEDGQPIPSSQPESGSSDSSDDSDSVVIAIGVILGLLVVIIVVTIAIIAILIVMRKRRKSELKLRHFHGGKERVGFVNIIYGGKGSNSL